MDSKWVWALGAGAVGVVLLLARKASAVGDSLVSSVVDEGAFLASLPGIARKGRFGDLGPVFLRVAKEESISPFVIAALAERESQYGTLLSKDGKGDGGSGFGLMQIDKNQAANYSFINKTMPDGTPAWLDAYENVSYAIRSVFKPYLFFFTSKPRTPTATVPADRVRIIRQRLLKAGREIPASLMVDGAIKVNDVRPLQGTDAMIAAFAAYNGGTINILWNLGLGLPADATTTGYDYGTDVFRRFARLRANAGEAVV